MTKEITWHLIAMVILSILLLISIFRSSEFGLDFSAFFFGLILIGIWLIYGGIYFW